MGRLAKKLVRYALGGLYPMASSAYQEVKYRMGSKVYSQEGENKILERIFGDCQSGFYVDIGAHHPFRFSNTYLFYSKGWRGINIDAAPGSMALFDKYRSRDINLEIGVGARSETSTFYVFNEAALNTFDAETANLRDAHPYHIKSQIKVQIMPLADLLAEYLPDNASIDFMTIDVEGKDMEVLQSNDFYRFRPRMVLVETFGETCESLLEGACAKYMRSVGYAAIAKTVNTTFFVDLEKK